jgi:MFS transporter, DHA1 family, multidrug resistance protein
MLPAIGVELGVCHDNDVQLVISARFLGFCRRPDDLWSGVRQLRRKPAIYAGFAIFIAGCLLSMARGVEVMLLGSFRASARPGRGSSRSR